jgi:hypothetical protein
MGYPGETATRAEFSTGGGKGFKREGAKGLRGEWRNKASWAVVERITEREREREREKERERECESAEAPLIW